MPICKLKPCTQMTIKNSPKWLEFSFMTWIRLHDLNSTSWLECTIGWIPSIWHCKPQMSDHPRISSVYHCKPLQTRDVLPSIGHSLASPGLEDYHVLFRCSTSSEHIINPLFQVLLVMYEMSIMSLRYTVLHADIQQSLHVVNHIVKHNHGPQQQANGINATSMQLNTTQSIHEWTSP